MPDGMRIDWSYRPNQMAANVERYKERLLAAVYTLAQAWARRLEAYAKANAPWTDRTGAARRSLRGQAFKLAVGAVLVLSHGVYYGQFLERRWAGRFSIIAPTIQANQAAVIASLQRLVK